MVSIVIPNYNGIKYLEDCIKSVENQTYSDYELIIVDNASKDDDYLWIKQRYPWIVFKQLKENFGFSKAVNEGIRLAKGEYVLLLNNDTVLDDDFLDEIVKEIEKDSRLFAVGSKMIAYHDQSLIDDAGDEYTLLGWTLKCGDGKSVEYYTKPRETFSACAGAALYRRDVFDEIGYFDESFFAYMEDVDTSYRARIYGYRIGYCPTARVLHIGSATSGSRYNDFKVKLAARNNVYVPYKNMPIVQYIFNLPFLMLGTLIKLIFFTKKGMGKTYIKGVCEGISKCSHIDKVKYSRKHLLNYIHIEWLLIKNTFGLVRYKLFGPSR